MEETTDLVEQNETNEFQVNVPQDAQGFILAFLPGRVVVKFRRVCRFWRDIVEKPIFVDHHLRNSFRFHKSIACFTSLDRGLAHMYTFDPTSMNFKSAELVLSDRFHMSGPCNGLVCAYDYKGNAEVLNPTMQRQLSLPVSGVKWRSFSSEYFLGFVQSTKEYKVVSVRHHMLFLTFEICTIGTLSWKVARQSTELLKTTKAVIVNDAIYWLLLLEGSSVLCREILMLNLTDEKFYKMALPEAAKGHDLTLLEGEGKLHLLSTPASGSNNTVSDIWVLDRTRKIWVRLETVAPRVPAGMSLFVLCKMKIFCGNQDTLFCADLLDGTVSYIHMPSGESLISCGTFVESVAPAVASLLNSTASSSSNGARLTELSSSQTGSSSYWARSSLRVLRRSSDVIGWSTSDLKESLESAKRTVKMEWKVSKLGLIHTPT